MAFKPKFGDRLAQDIAARISSEDTITSLKALPPKRRHLGLLKNVESDGSEWVYSDTSTLTGDDILVATPSDSPSAGRWLRLPGWCQLRLPFTYATADAATLLTIPTGCLFVPTYAYWDITADMTGGAASAIGLYASATWTTKGDMLGGAAGDVAATLTAGVKAGTVGAVLTSANRTPLIATQTVKFGRITSAFTAGSGYGVLVGHLIKHAGALWRIAPTASCTSVAATARRRVPRQRPSRSTAPRLPTRTTRPR